MSNILTTLAKFKYYQNFPKTQTQILADENKYRSDTTP